MTVGQGYAYDNQSAQAGEQHEALAAMLDGQTRQRIEGLLDLPGKRCLEVAAGGGSIATWLAQRVGPQGHVVATDLKPQRIPDYPGLEVRQHDITSDEPLGTYHLVHARLLLNHLPDRRRALRNMIGALEPAGALLTEDFVPTVGDELVAYGPDPAHALLSRYQKLHLQILASHGNDRNWSRGALLAFNDEGLQDVTVTVHGSSWRGGDQGCRLLRAGMGQLREELLAVGMTGEELEQAAETLMDPRLIINGYLVYLTSGRKPA